MSKNAMLQKLNPKPRKKVQKSKVQKPKSNINLIATSESLAEREYTYEQNMDVHLLVEGIDLNMIKPEEIKLETHTMECDIIDQFSTNLVHTNSEVLVKNEPESFLVTETLSSTSQAKTTVSIPARKQRKRVTKERLKIAKEQRKRQVRRARNPDRYEENVAQLPDYREFSRSLNQTRSNVDNVEEVGPVSSVDINSEANETDIETQNVLVPETYMAGDTNQEAHSTLNFSTANFAKKEPRSKHTVAHKMQA